MKNDKLIPFSKVIESTMNSINQSYRAGMEAGHPVVKVIGREAMRATREATSPEDYFQSACSDARAAFWRQIQRYYPEIARLLDPNDGDQALTLARFEIATEGAADELLAVNGIAVQVLDSVEGGGEETDS